MIRYSYSEWRGRRRLRTVERSFPLGKAPETIFEDGHMLERDIASDVGTLALGVDWPKPIHSVGAGFCRSQRKAAMEAAEKARVPLELDGKGNAIFHNREQRRKVLRWRGMHDNDGGYSD